MYPIEDLDDATTLGDLAEMAEMDPQDWPRTVTFNPSPLWDDCASHVEVRLLNGTTDAEELLGWVSLWMRILWAAAGEDRVSGYDLADPADNFPDQDIEDVLRIIGLPTERKAFLERLQGRQEKVFDLWRRHEDLRAWLPAERRPAYLRTLPDISSTLRANRVVLPQSREFTDLDEAGRCWALWCVLDGDGTVPRDDATIRKCAERLRDAHWASFRVLNRRSNLYRGIGHTLEGATREGNGWLEIPMNRHVRAYRRFAEMDDEQWRVCVMRALSRRNGSVERYEVVRDAFDEARARFGIERQNLVRSVEAPIRSAINSCIRRGFIRRDGAVGLTRLARYDDLD